MADRLRIFISSRVKDAVLGRDGKRRALREIRREIKDTLQAASCCRKARFSRASWRWPPHRNGRSRSRWSRRMIIGLGLSLAHSRQINHLLTGRSFGEGQHHEPLFVEAEDYLTVDLRHRRRQIFRLGRGQSRPARIDSATISVRDRTSNVEAIFSRRSLMVWGLR